MFREVWKAMSPRCQERTDDSRSSDWSGECAVRTQRPPGSDGKARVPPAAQTESSDRDGSKPRPGQN